MADLKLVGAVAIKVRPNAKGFKGETEDQVKDQLRGVEAEVKVKVKGDVSEAKRDVEKAGKAIEKQSWSMKVGVDYESVIRAEKALEKAIKGLGDQKISVTLDEEGIIDARGQLAEMAQGAQIEMTYVQDDKGYQSVLNKIAEIRRQKLETEISFGYSEEELRTKEAEMKALLAEGAAITVSYNNDRASIERSLAQIKAEQDKIQAVTFDVLMDPQSLDTAQRVLEAALAKVPVKLKVNYDDQASLKSTRDKLQSMLSDVLSKELEVLVNEEDIKAKLAEINDLIEEEIAPVVVPAFVTIRHGNDRTSLKAAMDQIKKELDKVRSVKFDVELDENQLDAKLALLELHYANTPMEIKFTPDEEGYNAVLSQLKTLKRERAEIPISFMVDEDGIAAAELAMRQALWSLKKDNVIAVEIDRQAKNKVQEDTQAIQNSLDGLAGKIDVSLVGSEVVAARLAFLGRDRIVNFFANVSTASIATAEGALRSLGGLNTLGDAADMLKNLFTRFDQIAVKASNISVTLGSIVNTLVAATTSVFSIGQGVAQSLGLLAAAPAVLGAATVGYTIFTAAFNNFFDAFNKDPVIAKAALAALPPLARKTVDSITGLYKGLANPIQEKFWEHMGGTLAETIETLYPSLKAKLLESTEAVGDFVGGMARSFNKLALSDDFDRMFAGFNGFFRNLSGASEPFFDAWNKFGVQGSELLPQFGTWLTNLAVQFDAWATKMAANGGITDMIMHGVHSLQNMWEIGKSVVDMFGAIARASGLAGAGGLAEFSVTMRRIADQMNGEPWQTKAALIFEGARKGASGLMDGFRDLGDTIGDSAVKVGRILELLGQIGGAVVTNFAALIDTDKFQSGIIAGLEGMLNMMRDLKPAAKDLGDIIGNLATIAGAVFASMAPAINRLFGTVREVVDKVAANLAGVAPKLANTVGAILGAATPALLLMADALNLILGAINKLPDSFVVAGVAVASFFALRALASKFWESVSGGSYFKTLESNWVNQQVAAGKTVSAFREVDGELRKVTSVEGKFRPTQAAFQDITTSVTGTVTGIRDLYRIASSAETGLAPLTAAWKTGTTVAGNFIKAAGSGLLGALGGPWGLAISAAAVGIGVFAQSQADAKAHVDDLTKSVDAQTGVMNEAGLKKIALAWTDVGDAGDAAANAMRGAAAANETASKLGLNFVQVTKDIASGGPGLTNLQEKLMKLGAAMQVMAGHYTGSGGEAMMNKLRGDADEAAKAFGLTLPQLEKMGIASEDVLHLAKNIREEAAAAELARVVTQGLADATGESTIAATQMATAMATIGDNSLTASSKIGAIRTALDLLKGGSLSAREAEVVAQQSFQSAIAQAEALKEKLAGNAHLFNETTKLIDITSTSGLGLQQAMKTAADGILVEAQAAYDAAVKAKKTPEEASAAALAIVGKNQEKLAAFAAAAGIPVEKLQAEWATFFGQDHELTAIFSARADEYQAVRAAVEESGKTWDASIWQAYLTANPDGAKIGAEEARKWGDEFAQKEYKALLDAIPEPARTIILEATGQANAYKDGQYKAVLDAINATGPGVSQALAALFAVKNGDYAAAIKAFMDAVHAANVKAQLDGLAAHRTAIITAKLDYGDIPAFNPKTGQLENRLGSIMDKFGRGLHGFNPEVRHYAGGGIERHVAQIASGRGPVRVWGERETHGEAYIPYAQSKRPRSLAILSQVAKDFGYTLSKATQYASGGLAGHTGPSTTNNASVTIGTLVTTDADAAVRKIRTSQQDALAVAGITLNGA